ncbi:MAG: Fic family protein [Capsulimonadaceae bacterium]|nr:Fic family protein [Capsulimonadaceae bacterium]
MAEKTPVGQMALHKALKTSLPLPAVHSFAVDGARRTVISEAHVEESYPRHYDTDGTLLGNLRFALKHEPLDLRIIHAALIAIGEPQLVAWLRDEPVGIFSRRAWFLYETLTGNVLGIESARSGNYVDALDPRKHFVGKSRNSSRHRVRDNLLGNRDFCPVVRRTQKIETMMKANIRAEAMALTSKYSADVLARSANFLITKETRSSFAIEGETPSSGREERFVAALEAVPSFKHDSKEAIVELQNQIVDPRYAANDWRDFQNFVGQTTRGFGEHVHFVCPRPEDVPTLMEGWMALTQRLIESSLDPVLAAAVSAFGFVFVHPFEDGNGRIHRFMIHYMLAKGGFSPPGIVFPISASILRQMNLYDKALEAFSKGIMPAIDWKFTLESAIQVNNNTFDLYRFFDATPQVEYLYERVLDTVRVDFKEELEFLDAFDGALAAIGQVIDMPDRKAALLAKLCLQNGGRLSAKKRSLFSEITDDEVRRIEVAIAASRQ